jgi:hypothetical protein
MRTALLRGSLRGLANIAVIHDSVTGNVRKLAEATDLGAELGLRRPATHHSGSGGRDDV